MDIGQNQSRFNFIFGDSFQILLAQLERIFYNSYAQYGFLRNSHFLNKNNWTLHEALNLTVHLVSRHFFAIALSFLQFLGNIFIDFSPVHIKMRMDKNFCEKSCRF